MVRVSNQARKGKAPINGKAVTIPASKPALPTLEVGKADDQLLAMAMPEHFTERPVVRVTRRESMSMDVMVDLDANAVASLCLAKECDVLGGRFADIDEHRPGFDHVLYRQAKDAHDQLTKLLWEMARNAIGCL
jgi:hypothetical protein